MFCAAQVVGRQLPPSCTPHCPATPPPPQVWPAGQLPQESWPPQPSPAGPQERLCCAQVSGTHFGELTQDVRSKSMNSRSFSCGVSVVPLLHSLGNFLSLASLFDASSTWKSLKTTRPQVPAAWPALKGVSNV